VFLWLPLTLAVLGWFPAPFSKIEAIGRWPITHVLRFPEHFAPSPTAANYLPHYLASLIVALVSTAISIGWALANRRPASYSRAFVWTHTTVRYLLAALMLSYGWNKVMPGQFGRFAAGAGVDYLIHQVGQLPPRDLLWAFMEASRSYQVFTGLAELAAGLLLLMRSTAMVGALLSVAAITNVAMLDIGYDVAVKFLAGQMLLMALFVSVPYAKAIVWMAVPKRDTQPVQLRPLFMNVASDRIARLSGVVAAAVIIVLAFRFAQAVVEDNRTIQQTPLHGIWDVEEISRNGVSVPLLVTDDTLWRRLIFPWSGTRAGAIIVWMSEAVTRCSSSIDLEAKRIDLVPLRGDSTVAGSIFGVPGPNSRERQTFAFSTADDDHLVLRRTTAVGDALVIRLRRFSPATYPLISHKSEWRW